MRRKTTLIVSCGEELKVKMQTVIHTRDKEDDNESVASSNFVDTYSTRQSVHREEPNEDVATANHITICEEAQIEDEDAKDAPPELEEGVKVTVDELKEINLGDDNDPRPTYISALLSSEEEETYIQLLQEFKDVFKVVIQRNARPRSKSSSSSSLDKERSSAGQTNSTSISTRLGSTNRG